MHATLYSRWLVVHWQARSMPVHGVGFTCTAASTRLSYAIVAWKFMLLYAYSIA
jgi:hypothetical protein